MPVEIVETTRATHHRSIRPGNEETVDAYAMRTKFGIGVGGVWDGHLIMEFGGAYAVSLNDGTYTTSSGRKVRPLRSTDAITLVFK